MKNIKKILVLTFMLIAIVGIIAPADAKLYTGVGIDSLKADNGKTKLEFFVQSYGAKNPKKELNNVYKAVVSIEGYKSITFKKPVKGWKQYKQYGKTVFNKYFKIKGQPKKLDFKKKYTIKLYNKKGKLIKTEKNVLASMY